MRLLTDIDIIAKTYEFVDALKNSSLYKSYLRYKKLSEENPTTQRLIKEFSELKNKYAENEYDKNMKEKYQTAKVNLMNDNIFGGYKTYEKELETFLGIIENSFWDIVKDDKCGNIKKIDNRVF